MKTVQVYDGDGVPFRVPKQRSKCYEECHWYPFSARCTTPRWDADLVEFTCKVDDAYAQQKYWTKKLDKRVDLTVQPSKGRTWGVRGVVVSVGISEYDSIKVGVRKA